MSITFETDCENEETKETTNSRAASALVGEAATVAAVAAAGAAMAAAAGMMRVAAAVRKMRWRGMGVVKCGYNWGGKD